MNNSINRRISPRNLTIGILQGLRKKERKNETEKIKAN